MKPKQKAGGPYSSPPEDLSRAKEFLLAMLRNGPCLSKEVGEAAEEKGIGNMLFFHARKELGVKAERVRRSGDKAGFIWQLSLPDALVAKSMPSTSPIESKPVSTTKPPSAPIVATTNGNGTHELIQAVEAQTAQLEREIADLQERRATLEAEIAAKMRRLEGLLQANMARSAAETALRNLLGLEGV